MVASTWLWGEPNLLERLASSQKFRVPKGKVYKQAARCGTMLIIACLLCCFKSRVLCFQQDLPWPYKTLKSYWPCQCQLFVKAVCPSKCPPKPSQHCGAVARTIQTPVWVRAQELCWGGNSWVSAGTRKDTAGLYVLLDVLGERRLEAVCLCNCTGWTASSCHQHPEVSKA